MPNLAIRAHNKTDKTAQVFVRTVKSRFLLNKSFWSTLDLFFVIVKQFMRQNGIKRFQGGTGLINVAICESLCTT